VTERLIQDDPQGFQERTDVNGALIIMLKES